MKITIVVIHRHAITSILTHCLFQFQFIPTFGNTSCKSTQSEISKYVNLVSGPSDDGNVSNLLQVPKSKYLRLDRFPICFGNGVNFFHGVAIQHTT
jgi:hypothetical protein